MTAREYFERGKALHEEGCYEEALEAYDQAIQRDENDAYLWYGKGTVYKSLNDYEQALYCYEQAIQLDEKFAYPWNGKGNVYSELKDYEQALNCYEQAIKLDKKYAAPWHGKGNVYSDIKDYEQALYCYAQAIQQDENWATPWNGKGNVYSELKDYEQALYSYDQAIQQDENYAAPWNGKGTMSFAINDFELALFCYEQAIHRDENSAAPWNGKGVMYEYLEDYESSKISYMRAFKLEGMRHFIFNSLILFSRYPTAPFYTYRLISDYLSPDVYNRRKLLVETTFGQCRNLQAYTAWLQLSGRQQQVKGWEWEVWRGIVHYFMGDPVASFELFREGVLPKRPKDLRARYYLIQSCYGFAEPSEKHIEEALKIVEEYQPAEKTWLQKWICKKKTPGEAELQQRYYAGLLLYHAEKKEEALRYFQAIEKNYLPAAYMSLLIQYKTKKAFPEKLLQFILKEEMQSAKTGKGFATGMYKHRLNLEREDFQTPFFRYAHYIECFAAIRLVFHSEARRQNKKLRFGTPYPEDFWDVWLLEKEDYRRIFQLAREVRLQRKMEKIFRARTQALKREAKQAEFSLEKAEDRIREQESERLFDAYEKLVGESSAERREQRLGGMISEWALSKPDHYHTLTTALYLQELFTEQQKVMLDFYARIQHYARQKPSDVLFAGLKDEVKELIGKGIDLLASTLDFSGALVSVVFKPLAKGALGELIIQWLKIRKAEFKTYSEFREGFRQFIGEEKERLGERFEERYPMYGFEGWLG